MKTQTTAERPKKILAGLTRDGEVTPVFHGFESKYMLVMWLGLVDEEDLTDQ